MANYLLKWMQFYALPIVHDCIEFKRKFMKDALEIRFTAEQPLLAKSERSVTQCIRITK